MLEISGRRVVPEKPESAFAQQIFRKIEVPVAREKKTTDNPGKNLSTYKYDAQQNKD